MHKPLKYAGCAIVLQEVPYEISLAFSISGCPHGCPGCHSQYLWEYEGEYLLHNLRHEIESHPYITCVCFFGGDQNMAELAEALKIVKKEYKLMTCVYSGCNDEEIFEPYLYLIDWLKIGCYNQELTTNDNIQYGVKLATSNQHLYKKGVDY